MRNKLRTVLDLAFVALITLVTAYQMGLLSGFPKGKDVYGYLTKIRLINDYFPHINWNPFWDSGTPFSIWSYPPLPMTFTNFIFVRLLGQTPEQALVIMGGIAFTLFVLGIYGFVFEVTGKRLAAILSVILFISSPTSWDWWSGGNYVRLFGLPFFSLSLFLGTRFLKQLLEGKESRLTYILLLLTVGLAFSSHLLMGGITAASLSLIFFLGVSGFGQKIKTIFKVLVPGVFLAGYYYLPLFLTGKPQGRFFGINPAFPIPLLNWLFPQEGEENFSLFPTLIIAFLFSFFLFLRARKIENRVVPAVILGFGIFLLFSLAYNLVGFLPFYPATWYIVGFPPITAFPLVSYSLSIMAGIFLGVSLPGIFREYKLSNGILLGLVILNLALLPIALPHLRKTVQDVSIFDSPESMAQQVIKLSNSGEKNYRFGTDTAFVSDWFTYVYDMPQTRDYFGQGIPYVNWQNWLETAIWAWRGNYPETNFLMDWYAISDFYVGEPHFVADKFLNREDFTLVKSENFLENRITLYHFAKNSPSKILAATDTPVALVIGAEGEYDVFLRALAQVGIDSRRFIPIYSQARVDELSLKELKRFNAIVLYNYTYRNKTRTYELLKDFVEQGGKLFIDTSKGKETESEELPDFFPMEKTQPGVILGDWKVSVPSLLRDGARVEKEIEGKAVVISYESGNGKVVWSGMNYPFYISERKIKEDIKLFEELINWLSPPEGGDKIQEGEVKFINPEKREIIVGQKRKGVLFKETKFTSWQASVNGKKTDIYFAGPGFMYVFLENTIFPATIVFEYKLSPVEIIGFVTALLTLFGICLYALEGVTRRQLIPRIKADWLREEE